MSHAHRLTLVSLTLSVLLGAGAASALTICISPCLGITGPTPPLTSVDPLDLPVLDTAGITGWILGSGDPGGAINVAGDLVLHVPSGILEVTDIDLRTRGVLVLGSATSSISVFASGSVNLCAEVLCEPVGTATPEFDADPFHIAVLGPLTGALGVFAGGDILLTTAALPVPEPGTALLFSLAGLAISRRRRAA